MDESEAVDRVKRAPCPGGDLEEGAALGRHRHDARLRVAPPKRLDRQCLFLE